MLQSFKTAVQIRAFLVFVLIHAGLGIALFELAVIAREPALAGHFPWLLAGILSIYGGMCLGVFFIVWPMLPWISRARRMSRWREWVLDALPEILATLPVIIQAAKSLQKAWEDMKGPVAPGSGEPMQPQAQAAPAAAPTVAAVTPVPSPASGTGRTPAA